MHGTYCWIFCVKENEVRHDRALKKAKDNQEMCKVRDKEIDRRVTAIPWTSLFCRVVIDTEK